MCLIFNIVDPSLDSRVQQIKYWTHALKVFSLINESHTFNCLIYIDLFIKFYSPKPNLTVKQDAFENVQLLYKLAWIWTFLLYINSIYFIPNSISDAIQAVSVDRQYSTVIIKHTFWTDCEQFSEFEISQIWHDTATVIQFIQIRVDAISNWGDLLKRGRRRCPPITKLNFTFTGKK